MALELTPCREDARRLVASKFPQFLAAFFATLSALGAGAALAWSSPVLPLLQSAHVVTEGQAAWVGALITLGAFVGALPAGAFANIVGRKGLLVS
ncbi:solute carrier family 2, facilitated glucose transporter member 8-like [Macrosteles quadrilineatus]|uniref:solute carrier family 2, facilitated glucose transporter member 8-like n=1 Tax=Macrosteles quadrilineatus TaxID=74068 RepID=UPI0023E2905A|nr:solute carrier family 2, facilitated glucose transporter member 8-like [Macrosteles quadrilineatus]